MKSQKVILLNCVGLSPEHIGANTPHLESLAKEGQCRPMTGILPGLTCSSQSTMLTGKMPRDHGIVGNGWYFRDLDEVMLWRQSNRLVQGPKIWDLARQRNPAFTVCNMFWWYNMNADVDFSLTPRPLYFADGLKLPGLYGQPLEFRRKIEESREPFPLFNFWGPAANLRSSQWIVEASLAAMRLEDPTLTLVYVPHLDYDLQRFGPDSAQAREQIRALDACIAPLINFAKESNREIVVVSEYGLENVETPIHINRILRAAGFLATVPQLDRENLDPGASRAFAVADHQIAHVYVKDSVNLKALSKILAAEDGIECVLDKKDQEAFGLEHERSGDLVCVAAKRHWFSYYFWENNDKAPDYARAVDIHRKPGYDPVELFLDPEISFVKAKILWRVLQKKLGFRMLMDVIPLDANLVRGSHGRLASDPEKGPIFLHSEGVRPNRDNLHMKDVCQIVLDTIFGS